MRKPTTPWLGASLHSHDIATTPSLQSSPGHGEVSWTSCVFFVRCLKDCLLLVEEPSASLQKNLVDWCVELFLWHYSNYSFKRGTPCIHVGHKL